MPPFGAGEDKVTTPVAVDKRLAFVCTNLIAESTGASTIMLALTTIPLRDAVTVAGVSSSTDTVVMGKVALLAPLGRVILAGVDTSVLLLDKVTVIPEAGATPFI
jgi:hypothetical protein